MRLRLAAYVLALGSLGGLALAPTLARAQETAPAGEAQPDAEPAPAEAEPSPQFTEALERFDQAQAIFERGDHGAALAEFQRIYELLAGHPNRYFVLFNIARAFEELHRYDRAIEYYQRYLDEGGAAAENRADVEASLRALERLLGTIAFTAEVAEPGVDMPVIEVWIGANQVGNAPGEVRIPGGQHTVELRAQGFEPVRREVQVASRQRVEVHVVMHQLSTFRGVSPALFVASTALAVVAAGVGAGLGIYALQLHNDGNRCAERVGCVIDAEAQGQQIRDVALGADVLFGTAALFAITAIVLIPLTDWGGVVAQEREDAAQTPTAILLPVLSPSYAGGAFQLTF